MGYRYRVGYGYYENNCDDCTGKLCLILTFANLLPWLIICGILIVVIIPIGFYAGLMFDSDMYSPMETRIVQRDGTFCGGLVLNVTSRTTGATLYRLSQTPRVGPDDNGYYTITQNNAEIGPTSRLSYWSWQFHLLPGSNVSINVCPNQESGLRLYVFQGDAFERWINNSRVSAGSFASEIESVPGCPYAFSKVIPAENDWAFVLHSPSSTINYNANFSLLRTVYIIENVVESCSAGGGNGRECTVSNDRSSTYVVATGSGPLLDYEQGLPVQVRCQLAGGPIAGIVISAMLVYLLFCAVLVLSILWCARCIDRRKSGKSGKVKHDVADLPTEPTYPEPVS